jgi:hypothetical protein
VDTGRRAVTRLRRLAAWVNRRFTPVALVATAAGLALALWGQRGALEAADWHVDWLPLLAGLALFAVAPLVQAASFWMVLRFLGVPAPFTEAIVIWTRSFLLRYAPTGALAFALRIRERDRLAARRSEVLTASAYEQLVALVAGAIAGLAGFALGGGAIPRTAVVACVVAVLVAVAVRPRFLGRPLQRLAARRGLEIPALLRGRRLAIAVAVNVLGWVATGAACWLVVRALVHGDLPNAAWLLGAYSLAWLLGFVVPLLPGGLGLREGTLIAFLSAPFSAGVATALALALRFASTVGELLAVGVVELAYRLAGGATREPRPEEASTN